MTPKDKARELVNEFMVWQPNLENFDRIGRSRECALICVNKILGQAQMVEGHYHQYESAYIYYKKVQQELENL